MLLEFSVENFGPFDRETKLSMLASALSDRKDAVIPSDLTRNGVLKSVTVFGPNASGKSYLFKAFDALKSILCRRRTPNEPIIPYNPFRVREERSREPTSFRIRLSIGGVLYDYSVSYTGERIVSEQLWHYPKRYPVKVFGRGDGGDDTKLIEHGKLTKTTSYLLSASEYNDAVCSTVLGGIMNIMTVGDISPSLSRSLYSIANSPELKKMAMDALDAADLGVKDIRIVPGRDDGYSEAWITHGFDEGEMTLPLEMESNGTREMLSSIVPMAVCLREGRTLVIDEFGSKLHHGITRWMMDMFNSSANGGAQLIVNTHDLGLMDIREMQRRDQILFVNKSRETGSSEVYPLTAFKGITKSTDVLSDYMDGRFDAVPLTVRRDIS